MAIEGGWNKDWRLRYTSEDEMAFDDIKHDAEDNPCHYINVYKIICDASFWQSIGKACGWSEDRQWYYYDEDENESILGGVSWYPWQYYAHELYDLILTSSDLSPFWESIKSV